MYACQMPDDIDVRNVIYVIYDIYDMNGALTYIICMYVNMGVKRSIRTSGMQQTILKINIYICQRESIVLMVFTWGSHFNAGLTADLRCHFQHVYKMLF